MARGWSVLGFAAMAALIGMIGAARADGPVLTGTVVYLERMLLPDGAEATVKLEDVSLADAPAKTVAEVTVAAKTSPTHFVLSYPATDLKAGHSYALRASISAGGELLFTTTDHVAFDPSMLDVELRVSRVAPPAEMAPVEPAPSEEPAISEEPAVSEEPVVSEEPAPSEEPVAPAIIGSWLAEDIGGAGVIDNLQSTLVVAADGAVNGDGGCNGYGGTATISGEAISFGPLAGTLMACADAIMDQERRFFDALNNAASFRVDAETSKLFLLDASGAELVRFTAN